MFLQRIYTQLVGRTTPEHIQAYGACALPVVKQVPGEQFNGQLAAKSRSKRSVSSFFGSN